MSIANGEKIIRIGRKGRLTFAFGEESSPKGLPFTIDVVSIYSQWNDIDRAYRGEDGTVPPERRMAMNIDLMKFVCELSKARMPGEEGTEEELTLAEALDFMARLREEVDRLEDFFQPKLREKPSSQPSSTAVKFSQ